MIDCSALFVPETTEYYLCGVEMAMRASQDFGARIYPLAISFGILQSLFSNI